MFKLLKRLSASLRYPLFSCVISLCFLLIGFVQLALSQPKNILFFIGDGMGFEQVKAAGMYANGMTSSLSFETLPYQAEMTTYSANNAVTDSAAAATAMATGVKVNNGVISLAIPGDGSELETLLEYFQGLGKMVGLVTTTYMTHATPACFGAHETSRDNYANIASDYLNQTRLDVLFGGSSYMGRAAAAGYTVVTDRSSMYALDFGTVVYASGQFGSGHMPYEHDGLGSLPHLSEMTEAALDILDRDTDGFFLMVEGGRIDHAGHDNDLIRNVHETIEFANAVQAVLDWAAGRTDTLIIVTADHETGGLTVIANNGQGNYPTVTWSTGDHTAANVPIYAWGVNAEMISGVLDNTDLFGVVIADTGSPAILFTSPENGALDVPVNYVLTATFSEPMDPSTINKNTFIVSTNGQNISGTITSNSTATTFTPASRLAYDTLYTATITDQVKNLAGNNMASEYTWNFTTERAPSISKAMPWIPLLLIDD